MMRSRSWFGWNKPKNRLSLDGLKYLHSILEKNQTVSEQNRSLLVESLRSIAEILIWGDQNDGSVFDFFLEKNMLSYFLHIMRQKSGGSSFVCTQLLQTLNILFENIRNETSLYYLLSNNHVNSIIVHKFDFSDEDVMGYYVLFLKTLSLKLNPHTIHFFYNEHTNDFPLYTEAIKFFNHPESMVRIAVRTISLNVYKVENTSMLSFIKNRTAAPYFSNLVWFIGKHILELDATVRNDTDHQSQSRLSNLVAEHLDHLHYLNDILCLDIADLNAVLTEHLLHKLFVPLYIFSLTPSPPPISMAVVTQNLAAVLNKVVEIDLQEMSNPRVSCVVALFLLSLVFLVIHHPQLVHSLAWVILNGDHSVFKDGAAEILNAYIERSELVKVTLGFGQPQESLAEALESTAIMSNSMIMYDQAEGGMDQSTSVSPTLSDQIEKVNITDEEKEKLMRHTMRPIDSNRPFLDMVLGALDCNENDYLALLGLCLLYGLMNNQGVNIELLEEILKKPSSKYNLLLIDKLLQIIHLASQPSCRVRLVTIELTLKLLTQLFRNDSVATISDVHRSSLFSARNQSMTVLRNFYKSEDIFLDLFEDEYNEMVKSNLNVEFLCMDSAILLPPTGTPLTGIGFTRRLPCGEVEKARRAIRVFFLLRRMCQSIGGETETLLPLTNLNACVQIEQALDLNNSDLIACTVLMKDGTKFRRFLVIDVLQLILVEPDTKKLGWGVAKLVGFLQDVEVAGDKDDSRCLHLTIHRGGATNANRLPILSAKFMFDDHIRCMAAKQRLTKGRSKARQKKMYQIAQLLEVPGQTGADGGLSMYSANILRGSPASVGGSGGRVPREHRPLFSTANRCPGVASALRRDSSHSVVSRVQMQSNRSSSEQTGDSGSQRRLYSGRRENSPSGTPVSSKTSREGSRTRQGGNNSPRTSREGSPRILRPRSEEIPLENFANASSRGSNTPTRPSSRSSTPIRISNVSSVLETIPAVVSSSPKPIVADVLASIPCEETSFIGDEQKVKKKGGIETV